MAILPCRAKTGTDRHSGGKWTLFLSLSILLISDPGPIYGKKYDGGIVVSESDHQTLQALRHEFIDLWGVLSSWNGSGAAACSGWAGIKCGGGQVIAIQLPWKGLGGRISDKIGQLQGLRRLSLHDNVLTGPVPSALGVLPKLRGVYLFNNRLSGSIPATISNCLVLQNIDLSNNQLTGVVPVGLANSIRLYRVNLSFNALSGPVPVSLSSSHSITILDLRRNNLSGAVPGWWGRHSRLVSISLDHNFLSGTIPGSLSNLTSLNSLDLSNNNLDGGIPESIGILRNLSVLNLSNNILTGRIPDTIGNLTGISSIDFSQNNLTGYIPWSLIKLQNLSTFDVSYNHLSGAVPPALARKFDSTAFAGNSHLCGYSSATQCRPPPPAPAENNSRRKLGTKDIILITAGVLLIMLLVLCCVLLCCLIRKRVVSSSKAVIDRGAKTAATPAVVEVESGGDAGGKLVHFDGPFVFTADDLLCATAEIMGKSAYGTVYKATLEDNNNNHVLVKRLREKIAKGQKEFEAEVVVLGRIRHPNILALRAYYLGPKGEKLLVYDYMPNGSVASFLHARGPETLIPWPTRMGIAAGIARGLCYLHNEVKIMHGNLTSSNVALGEDTTPMIGDVGMPRLMTSVANTDIIATAGAQGYRAPELSRMKNMSSKSDVFSLGVIILELLTGKSPSKVADEGQELPQWVASIVKEEWTNEVFDVELMRDASDESDELLNTLKLALHCVDPSPGARPEAQDVLLKLEEIRPDSGDVPGRSEREE